MNCNRYKTLSEETKNKKRGYGWNTYQISRKSIAKTCLKNRRKNTEKIISTTRWKKIKENSNLESVKVDVVTNFIKNEVESFSDAENYTGDDNYSKEDRVIGFR